MPYDTREKANEWVRKDKLKKPEVWKIKIRIQYLQRKLSFIENPKKYQAHLRANAERERKKRALNQTKNAGKNYRMESELK